MSFTDEGVSSAAAEGRDMLKDFKLYKWMPNHKLSSDENYLDLLMLVTRTSICRQGHMACILTDRSTEDEAIPDDDDLFFAKIIAVANNVPVYKPRDSDCHAEIHALGIAARRLNRTTRGATAYITLPPCKNCFAALWAAGIARIVSIYTFHNPVFDAALTHGITLTKMDHIAAKERCDRKLAQDPEQVEADRAGRAERKKWKQEMKEAKRRKMESRTQQQAATKQAVARGESNRTG